MGRGKLTWASGAGKTQRSEGRVVVTQDLNPIFLCRRMTIDRAGHGVLWGTGAVDPVFLTGRVVYPWIIQQLEHLKR